MVSESFETKEKSANGDGSSVIVATHEDFAHSVKILLEAFKSARRQLDFKNYPLNNMEEWEARIKVCH
jgi:hypothetical protein